MYNNSYQASTSMMPYEVSHTGYLFMLGRVKGARHHKASGYQGDYRKDLCHPRETQYCSKSPKSYVDLNQQKVEFDVGDFVFLKVSLIRGMTQFSIKGKLASMYIWPFKIVERVSDIAYCLSLPPHLGHIHNVFHVSMLKKYT